MIDYYETKQHPVTKRMVLDAYKKVLVNKGSAGIDGQRLEDFKLKASTNLLSITEVNGPVNSVLFANYFGGY